MTRFATTLCFAALLAPATFASHWALVINGDDPGACSASAHVGNVEVAIETLETLGFSSGNIKVLSHHHKGAAPAAWLKPDRTRLRSAIRELATSVGRSDTLVVYLTGHGMRRGDRSYLVLGRQMVPSEWLVEQIATIPYGKLVVISDQCYSGGFESFGELPRTVFVAATSAEETSSCVPFIRPFFRALVNPKFDRNGDGVVSIEEAFVVASARAEERALATRPSDPVYRGLGGRSLDMVAQQTSLSAIPATTTIAMASTAAERVAALEPAQSPGTVN